MAESEELEYQSAHKGNRKDGTMHGLPLLNACTCLMYISCKSSGLTESVVSSLWELHCAQCIAHKPGCVVKGVVSRYEQAMLGQLSCC